MLVTENGHNEHIASLKLPSNETHRSRKGKPNLNVACAMWTMLVTLRATCTNELMAKTQVVINLQALHERSHCSMSASLLNQFRVLAKCKNKMAIKTVYNI